MIINYLVKRFMPLRRTRRSRPLERHRLECCLELVNVPSPRADSDDTLGVHFDDYCGLVSERASIADGKRSCMDLPDKRYHRSAKRIVDQDGSMNRPLRPFFMFRCKLEWVSMYRCCLC